MNQSSAEHQVGNGPGHDGRRTVLFVVPSLNPGGAETQAIDLATGLPDAVWRKLLVCFEPGDGLMPRVVASGVKSVYLKRVGWLDTALVARIAKLIDQERVDVVHCTLPISLFFGAWAARLSRRRPPLVAALHTTRNHRWQAELLDWVLYRWILQRCVRVILVCEAQRMHWCAKFPELERRAVVIHNGIDIGRFDRRMVEAEGRTLREALGLGPGPVICQIAGFRPEKGHGLMLEAFEQLVQEVPGVQLLLVGDGPLRSVMEAVAARRGIAGNVRFLGVRADVRPVLAISECSVLPSTRETFSMAMLESLAMEVPVVATDVGGTREAVLAGRTGAIVPPGDVAALTQAIKGMLADLRHRKKLGSAGRSLVAQRFGRQRMIDRTAEVLAGAARRGEA